MADYLEGYEQDIEPGAGHNPVAGNRKVILHTTETGPGSFTSVRNMWRGPTNWAKGLPHFLMEGKRIAQLLPLSTCAYTSQNGGINANKAGCPIQIEIVHRAGNPFSNEEYDVLGKWFADLIKAGVYLDLDHCPQFYGTNDGIYPYLATYESPVRDIINNQFGGYTNFNGIAGHQHLEGNDHWDPGPFDIHRACDIARSHLGDDGEVPQEEEVPKTHIWNSSKNNRDWLESIGYQLPAGMTWNDTFAGLAAWETTDGEKTIRYLTAENLKWLKDVMAWQKGTGEELTIIDEGFQESKVFRTKTLMPHDKAVPGYTPPNGTS
jgi:hypothetical protein